MTLPTSVPTASTQACLLKFHAWSCLCKHPNGIAGSTASVDLEFTSFLLIGMTYLIQHVTRAQELNNVRFIVVCGLLARGAAHMYKHSGLHQANADSLGSSTGRLNTFVLYAANNVKPAQSLGPHVAALGAAHLAAQRQTNI